MNSPHLELSQVGMEFPTANGPFVALKDVNLRIKQGEFISLIGHSGCGKSTVLNIVAGLYEASYGGVLLLQPMVITGIILRPDGQNSPVLSMSLLTRQLISISDRGRI